MKLLEIKSCYQCYHVDYKTLICKHNGCRLNVAEHYYANTIHPKCELPDSNNDIYYENKVIKLVGVK